MHLKLFKIGSFLIVLTAIVHLVGFFSGGIEAKDAAGAELLEQIETYKFDDGIFQRSIRQFLNGYSIIFGYMLIYIAAVNFLIAHLAAKDVRVIRIFTLVNVLFLALFTMLSAIHLSLPLTVLMGISAFVFMMSVSVSAGKHPVTETYKDKL